MADKKPSANLPKSVPEPAASQEEHSPGDRARLATVAPTIESVNKRPAGRLHVQPVEDSDEFDLAERIHRNRTPLTSLLLSFIAHVSLFVLLALIVQYRPNGPASIWIDSDWADQPAMTEPTLETPTIDIVEADPSEEPSPLEMEEDDIADADEDANEATAIETAEVPVAIPSEVNNPVEAVTQAPAVPDQTMPTGGGIQGRSKKSRAQLAAIRGGTPASEEAVERGLRWIIEHQQTNGSWLLRHNAGRCNGRCRDVGTKESANAATGLALMALLGAGYTHQAGPYQEQVDRGLKYLKRKMQKTAFGGNLVDDSMYAQGIATIALVEAYHMTGDQSLRDPAEQAVRYIVSAQHKLGGWRYMAGEPGDMTVTGWQLMALKSAQQAGIKVPPETIVRARQFMDSLSDSGGTFYGYLDKKKTPTCSAIGLLSQMYLGWPREKGALQDGAAMLAGRAPSRTNVYYNYYSTQVLHHLSNDLWDPWNTTLREHLIATQDRRGHQNGSWFFRDEHGSVGGRLYTTAMCVMTLEVYYRYLPLYDDIDLD